MNDTNFLTFREESSSLGWVLQVDIRARFGHSGSDPEDQINLWGFQATTRKDFSIGIQLTKPLRLRTYLVSVRIVNLVKDSAFNSEIRVLNKPITSWS